MSKAEPDRNDPAKPSTLKARSPRGFADRSAADIAATERMLAVIRETYELYGFEAVETPFVEYTEALGKFLPDQDRPNEGVFSFLDDDEQWLSLRYDLTAPLARYVAEKLDAQSLTLPYRSYRAGWVFRNEKPGPGRFRQFMQFDADTVGSASPAADAEMCMMMADTLERLGIKRGQYVIRFSNRKILDGLMEVLGIDDARTKLGVFRALDKLERVGHSGAWELLGKGRLDESGDYTPGAGLSESQIRTVLNFATGEGQVWRDNTVCRSPTDDEWLMTGCDLKNSLLDSSTMRRNIFTHRARLSTGGAKDFQPLRLVRRVLTTSMACSTFSTH